MLGTIFIIIYITFYQYRKTERALEALKNLSSPRALVIRDGKETRIPGREVVPGDILLLNEGDRVAADAVLLNTLNLTLDESLLTGESVPVVKSTVDQSTGKKNYVFSGTLVVQGTGWARVETTGADTEFGKIGLSLKTIDPDETRLRERNESAGPEIIYCRHLYQPPGDHCFLPDKRKFYSISVERAGCLHGYITGRIPRCIDGFPCFRCMALV